MIIAYRLLSRTCKSREETSYHSLFSERCFAFLVLARRYSRGDFSSWPKDRRFASFLPQRNLFSLLGCVMCRKENGSSGFAILVYSLILMLERPQQRRGCFTTQGLFENREMWMMATQWCCNVFLTARLQTFCRRNATAESPSRVQPSPFHGRTASSISSTHLVT